MTNPTRGSSDDTRQSARRPRHSQARFRTRAALSLGTVALVVAGLSASVSVPPVFAQTTPTPGTTSDEVRGMLEEVRAKYNLPSLAGGFSIGTNTLEYAATGWRQWGAQDRVTDTDVYHLGSISKSMTGTLLGRLIEEGAFTWDSTLSELLPNTPMLDVYKNVTLAMVMAHRAGFTGNTYPPGLPATALGTRGPRATPEQRRNYVMFFLNSPPTSTPGTKYEYSNPGTTTAAYIAELKTGKPWEQLISEYVFQPLGLTSCSVGTIWPPNTQPHPHRFAGTTPSALPVDGTAGNFRVIDGADQARCGVQDVLRYTRAHALGELSETGFLKAATYKTLHTPRFGSDGYAAGWLLSPSQPWTGNGPTLSHAGSNTLNYANIFIAPASGWSFAVATNIGVDDKGSSARVVQATNEALTKLLAIANQRAATQASAPTTTTASATVPSTTVATASAAPTTTTPAGKAPTAKKPKCTVNAKTKKKTCK